MTETSLPSSDVMTFLRRRQNDFLRRIRTTGLDAPSASFLRGAVVPVGENVLAYNQQDHDDVEVATDSLSATFTISTPRQDRYGDVVVPKGCLPHIQNYIRNPQIFFAHRSTDFPIALARDPDGQSTLSVEEDRLRATAYFHEETDDARTVWRLVAAKILRATSIGFLPVRASVIGSDEEPSRRRRAEVDPDTGEELVDMTPWSPLRFLEWDLLEFSIVPVPANADCVDALTTVLSRGFIEGQKIPASVRKSLAPFALRAKIWSPGFDPAKAKFSGVLVVNGEEVEYDGGNIRRFGDVVFPEKKPTAAPAELPISPPSLSDQTTMSVETDPKTRETPETPPPGDGGTPSPSEHPMAKELMDCVKACHDCCKAIHDCVKCHREFHETAHKELCTKIDGLVGDVGKSITASLEKKAETQKLSEELAAKKAQEAKLAEQLSSELRAIKEHQSTLAQKFYRLTGEKV